MRSAVRLLALLLTIAACGRDARPPAPPAAAPDTSARADLEHRRDIYGGFGSQPALLQALADSAAKYAALEIRGTPTVIGGWEDTTRLLAQAGRFTLAYWSGRGDHWWHEVWGAINGRVILSDSTVRSARVVLLTRWKYRGIALVELERDGACPAAYRIIEYGDDVRATVTPEFGNCARPVLTRREELLRMSFPRSAAGGPIDVTYLGHGRIHVPGQPDPPEYPDSLYRFGPDGEAIAVRAGYFARGTDTTELHAWLATPAGPFSLSRTPTDLYANHEIRVTLGDTTILRDFEHNYTGLDTYVELRGRPTALVSIADGGNGCGSMYRIVSTGERGRPVLTREFGSCSGPEVRLDGTRMDLHFEPYYTYAVSMSPNFVEPPDEGYRYVGGSRIIRLY
ncbi:MAG TPA: hypothetical protein VJT67_09200 [Longimicrobiaceae bacterium]|nr:hypothetical protein [Longimicrobiaceae bacterium]